MKKLLSIVFVIMLAVGVSYSFAGDNHKKGSCCSKKTASTECSKSTTGDAKKSCCSKDKSTADASKKTSSEKKATASTN